LRKHKFYSHLLNFRLHPKSVATLVSELKVDGKKVPVFTNEFWTAMQRQGHSIHEISYRACFKPQLPRFFIELFTLNGNTVYDPFNGRGTTVIEAALMGRKIIANDVNPLSLILTRPRIEIPPFADIENRLREIPFAKNLKADIDLSMFYHRDTLSEIVSLRDYLQKKAAFGTEDDADRWLRMVATNRLTGHSPGFFSVYTLPPNQATSASRQKKINKERKQKPEYRDVKSLILLKSKSLLRDFKHLPEKTGALFLNQDAAQTRTIKNNSVALTVTSPPFLDVVHYADDNWLRSWFNNIDMSEVAEKITMSTNVPEWSAKMRSVFKELYRITQKDGIAAFEVGEVKWGKIKLEEVVMPLGISAGFDCDAIVINQQDFTKTANIWGISNNEHGTNSNRIVVFRKK
jgi:DNA modification methylase